MSHKPLRLAVVVAALLLCAAPALVAQTTVVEGTTDSGAFYRIEVPAGWTPAGGLVIWNHGFSLDPIGPVTDLGPLVDLQLAEGFAVAASSYSQRGWALFSTDRDLEEMVDAFGDEFGAPDLVIVTGASLGGAVTASALERADLGNVVGALPICGALAGSRNWDGAQDIGLTYNVYCKKKAFRLDGIGQGLPALTMTSDEIFGRIDACTGILTAPSERSKAQQRRLNKILKATQIPESFFATDMGFAAFGLADLIHDPAKLKSKQGVGNQNAVYPVKKVERKIERIKTKGSAERKLDRNFLPQGNVGDVKIVSIHTDKDGLVLVENEKEYADVVPAGNLVTGIVVEAEPSHCGFSVAEGIGAWEQLLDWVEGGPQPSVDDLQAECEVAAQVFGGPCRYDPDFVIPDMDGRVPPR